MHDIFETLEQTETWYGQDDFPYKLDEMEQSHRINVKNFLERRARHLHSRRLWREFKVMERAPEDVFDAWMAENETKVMASPADWLANTPFMKALEQAIKNHGTIDGEVVDSHFVDEKQLANVGAALARSGLYRMKQSPTGRLKPFSDPPLQGIGPSPVEEPKASQPDPVTETFECWKGHDDCTSEEMCSENSHRAWEASHDTTECGGMQNHCEACMSTW